MAILLLASLTGCGDSEGPPRAAVSGIVTLDGTLLTSGLIRFLPEENSGPGAATQIVNGEYQFTDDDGPVIALHRVEIEATDFQGFDIDDEAAFAGTMEKTGRSPLARNPVPAIYNQTSTLTARVTDTDHQTFRFDLISKFK